MNERKTLRNFFYSQIGNALVCLAVYTNHSMRTVTNIFIVNLAVADFFVILLCLPPTVVWDVTETWFLGEALCKVVIYFQVGCRYLARSYPQRIYESACLHYGNRNRLPDITCQKRRAKNRKSQKRKHTNAARDKVG